jgi:hypothetical protein
MKDVWGRRFEAVWPRCVLSTFHLTFLIVWKLSVFYKPTQAILDISLILLRELSYDTFIKLIADNSQ